VCTEVGPGPGDPVKPRARAFSLSAVELWQDGSVRSAPAAKIAHQLIYDRQRAARCWHRDISRSVEYLPA
jgi:hypothetical protein